jgi:hypothetical protein
MWHDGAAAKAAAKDRNVKRRTVRDLYCDTVDVKPIDFDWSDGYGSVWECYEACECDKCGAHVVLGGGGNCKHSEADDASECEGYIEPSEGPMMCYFYPLPEAVDVHGSARAIAHLPLCVVEFTSGPMAGTFALALTGGGQNLAWEICEAFMLLGYLPPSHFADLPAICGRGFSARDRWIASGCLRTCSVLEGWAQTKRRAIRSTLAFGRKYEAERKDASNAKTVQP